MTAGGDILEWLRAGNELRVPPERQGNGAVGWIIEQLAENVTTASLRAIQQALSVHRRKGELDYDSTGLRLGDGRAQPARDRRGRAIDAGGLPAAAAAYEPGGLQSLVTALQERLPADLQRRVVAALDELERLDEIHALNAAMNDELDDLRGRVARQKEIIRRYQAACA